MRGWGVEPEQRSTEASSYLVRVQVHISHRLNTDADCLTGTALGRPVSMKSRYGPISETDWIVFEARGFSSESEARQFGERLRLLVTIAGLCSHLGIDAGLDTPRSCFTEHAIERMGFDDDVRVPPEIHGILVLPDDGKSEFMYASGALSVGNNVHDAASLLKAIKTLCDCAASFDVDK